MSRTPRNEDIALMDVNPLDSRIPTRDQAVQSSPEENSINIFFSRFFFQQKVAIASLLMILIVLLVFIYAIHTARVDISARWLLGTDESTNFSEENKMTELEPYKPICLDHQWHEIEHACRNYYNSSSRCDLSAEEDKQLLKELQTCCEDEENCWPREMDEYCCQEEPCNNHKCKIPMPAKGTSVVSEAILKKMLQQEEEREGDGIFSKKILTRKQKKLIVKLHNFLNTKNSTVVREIINDLTLIIYNNEVIRPPITLTSFLDLSTVKEHRIHFLIDVVEQLSEEWHAAVDFTGFMCTSLPTCSELQATFRWNIKKKDYFVSKFKNNKSNVKPSIDEYPYWAGEE